VYKLHLLHSVKGTEQSARREQQFDRDKINPTGLFSLGFHIIQNSNLQFKI